MAFIGNLFNKSPRNSMAEQKEINIANQSFLTVSLKLSKEAKPTIIVNN